MIRIIFISLLLVTYSLAKSNNIDVFNTLGITTLIVILFAILKLLYKYFFDKNRIRNKKINKFLTFSKNEKYLKNPLYTENIILHRFNNYIEFELLEYFFQKKNPTKYILKYINLNKYIHFSDNEITFKHFNTKFKRNFYFYFNVVFIFMSLYAAYLNLSGFKKFPPFSKEFFIIVFFEILFLFGSIIFATNCIKLKDAEKFILEFQNNINKEYILNYLKTNKTKFFKEFYVKRIGLFGSYVRNKESVNSDINLVIKFKKKWHSMDSEKIRLKELLEKQFNKKVTIVNIEYIKSHPNKEILNEIEFV